MHGVARRALWRCGRRQASPALRPNYGHSLAIRCYKSSARRRSTVEDAFPSQLSDPSAAAIYSSFKTSSTPRRPQTLTEKIVQRYSVGLPEGKEVKSGDYVSISPRHCMTHDNSWPVATKFMAIGASKLHDPHQIVMTLDHDVQNKSETNLKKYRLIEEFARSQGVDFYPAGRGIGHQIMVEEGYAWPGTLAVASDSHSNMYGGVGCLGTPVVRTDAASIWATGRTWWQIPPVAKVTLTGRLRKHTSGKDVIVALCGLFNNDEVLNHAIEFAGSEETMRSLPVDARLTIANMTTEWGALAGLFPIDWTLQQWLREQGTKSTLGRASELVDSAAISQFTTKRVDELFAHPLVADKGATYAKHLRLDLSSLVPYVSGPNSVKISTPVDELAKQHIKVDKAYLVSCTNSRASDIAAAARVFRQTPVNHRRIPKHVKFYIAAASTLEYEAAVAVGDWQILLEAGAEPLPAGCGPCIGLGTGLLEPGEVGISASNRNFKGRMGSTEARAYLASPEVVAASALGGEICGTGRFKAGDEWSGVVTGEGDGSQESGAFTPEESLEKVLGHLDGVIEKAEQEFAASPSADSSSTESLTAVLPGFPEQVEGEIVFCDADNINTDGIYPGKFTYQDNVTREKMAEVCMSNYDPAFATTAQPGDILVSGFNFGTGSSREQAATCLLAKQIPLVVSGSFGNIFSRNSINNALMGLEVPRLIHRLREVFSAGTLTTTAEEPIKEPSENKESLDSPPPAPTATPRQEKVLTRRTGWTLKWDVRRSTVTITEGAKGQTWTEKVGELPPNVQEIIARGGLEKWVQKEIMSEESA